MKKRGLLIVAAILIIGIGTWLISTKKEAQETPRSNHQTQVRNDLEHYFSDINTVGTMVIEQGSKTTIINDKRAKQAYLPSSTFKVPNSLIALQEHVVSGPDEIMKGPHKQLIVDGKSFLPAICEGDLTFKQAFQNSCATVYQEIARKIPTQTYQRYINEMHYGNMNITSVPIDEFWLEGKLAITPQQQIDFLQKLYNNKLPFSAKAMQTTKDMMFVEEKDGAKIYGKTGWVFSQKPNVGWWIGWVEKDNKATFFAINLDINQAQQASARMSIAKEIFKDLHVVN